MRLSSDLITEFQDRYFKAFGEHISPEAAEMELLNLAELVKMTHLSTNNGDEHENEAKSHAYPIGAA